MYRTIEQQRVDFANRVNQFPGMTDVNMVGRLWDIDITTEDELASFWWCRESFLRMKRPWRSEDITDATRCGPGHKAVIDNLVKELKEERGQRVKLAKMKKERRAKSAPAHMQSIPEEHALVILPKIWQ